MHFTYEKIHGPNIGDFIQNKVLKEFLSYFMFGLSASKVFFWERGEDGIHFF